MSGLSGTVVLQDNGGDQLSVSSDGSFSFATSIADGRAYDVTVETSPSGQTCSVSGGAGTIAAANATGVAIVCTTLTLGEDDFNRPDGGLGNDWAPSVDGSLAIESQEAAGAPGAYAGDTRVAETYGSDQYSQVQVTSDPVNQGDWLGATVRNQNGGQDLYLGLYWDDQFTGNYELQIYRRTSGNFVQLGNTYTLSGPLLAGTQLTLSAVGPTISLLEEGVQKISVTDGTLRGGSPGIMTYGSATLDNWVGGNATGSTPTAYSIGGMVSGLSGTVVLQDNGGDDLSLSSNGSFTFAALVADRDAYDVTVERNPKGQNCTVSGGAGTVASANVTGAAVTCTTSESTPSLQIQYESTDTNGVASYDFTSSDDGGGTHVLRILSPTHPASGVPHNFLYVLPVESELGNTYGDGIETMLNLAAQNEYNLTIIEPSFGADPWYADSASDPSLQYESFLTKDLVPWVTQNFAQTGNEQNWLIGFSKSGYGAEDLILKHPDLFAVAAAWDFPADMSSYSAFGSSSSDEYGTEANFQANYRLTSSFLDAHKGPFVTDNRLWIGSYDIFESDMTDYDALLSSEGILHTAETAQQMAHTWDSGWVPFALAAMSQDGAALSAST